LISAARFQRQWPYVTAQEASALAGRKKNAPQSHDGLQGPDVEAAGYKRQRQDVRDGHRRTLAGRVATANIDDHLIVLRGKPQGFGAHRRAGELDRREAGSIRDLIVAQEHEVGCGHLVVRIDQ
jgi:hypothetical protein